MTTSIIGLFGVTVRLEGCELLKSQAYEILFQYAPLLCLPASKKGRMSSQQ